MRVIVILIVIGEFEIVSKGSFFKRDMEELEIIERIETIVSAAFFRLTRILKRVLVTK